ncbi:MAG: zinc-dependent peptidase [Chitinophagales bacterium]|nr:zinc-dependent peptidase [Chitinophagales bacterium]
MFQLIWLKIDEGFSNLENFLAVVFVIGAYVVLSLLFRRLMYGPIQEKAISVKNYVIPSKNRTQIEGVLSKYFPYYLALDTGLKKSFILRVEVFLEIKQFIPRHMNGNADINILIAASAAQLSFGLKNFEILHFDKILIYPDSYFSSIREQYHQGEVNVKMKLIILSVKSFLLGIQDANDGINLGLHEFAHALNIDAFITRRSLFFTKFYKEWQFFAELEMEKINAGQSNFLRKYASTNLQEMFAVCTENFFERPAQFKEAMPELYQSMVMVYRQNPLNPKNPLQL